MREPSVVAVDTRNDEVRCVGRRGQGGSSAAPPGSIVAVRPSEGMGVIADFDITANMLENFLKESLRQQPVCPAPGWSSASPRASPKWSAGAVP